MSVTYSLEPRDLRAFHRYIAQHHPSLRQINFISLWLFPVLTSACFAHLTALGAEHKMLVGFIAFWIYAISSLVIVRVLKFVLERIAFWRMFTSDKCKSQICEHAVELSDSAFRETTNFNENRLFWKGVYRVSEDEDYIYVLTSAGGGYPIPKRVFPDALSTRRFYERAVELHSGSASAFPSSWSESSGA